MVLGNGWPGGALLCTNCLRVVYVVNRTAEFAPVESFLISFFGYQWVRNQTLAHHLQQVIRRMYEIMSDEETHDREQPTVHPAKAFFADYRYSAMYKTTIPRISVLRVIYELSSRRHERVYLERVGYPYFIVSDGVTANMASTMPAPSPARRKSMRSSISLSDG